MKVKPKVPVAVFSGALHPTLYPSALEMGAKGVFPKDLHADEMIDGLKLILDGETFLPKAVQDRLKKPETVIEKTLTSREKAVLLQITLGRSNVEIAEAFDMTLPLVKADVRSIFSKLGVKNRTHAALTARNMGLA